MIDYAVLCRAIEDWKAGNALNIPASSPVLVATETVVDSYEGDDAGDEEVVETDVDAGEADVDAGEHEVDSGEGEGDVEVEGEAEAQQHDRTYVYQMPEIVDEEEQA
ncbi:hypothetical protein [Nannocystis bainbridge]|uniref:Uncharacterized protein n=1 Tax=Nannocystis bainbridge TaxID=2995303 RepID=A0ABT5E307_9BACT|nr:hypothetical protein [Nannocystis bainbridge]MDC0720135.1 hypothetical protein [Nannocystis bainbridge]